MANETEVQTGFFWHVHHDVLIEWCFDYSGRASFINTKKPVEERELRLRLFRPVKGALPQEVLEAGQAYHKAWQAYNEARRAYDEAWWTYMRQAHHKTWQAYDKARLALNEAGRAYDEAWGIANKVLCKNIATIEALHREECPNCPWNGRTILSR